MSFDQFCTNYRRKKILGVVLREHSQEYIEQSEETQEMIEAYK